MDQRLLIPPKCGAKLPCLRGIYSKWSSWTVTLSGDDMISNGTSGKALVRLFNIPSRPDINIANI